MIKDILVILMVAFGLFAIVMFVLFYVYLRKYYNNKHQIDDYEKIDDNDIEELDLEAKNDTINNISPNVVESDEFVPIKKQ